MNLNQWLEKESGRATRIAEHFGVTLSSVSQWKSNGVPKDRMKAVRDFTGNEVTLEEMIPDSSEIQPA